MGTWRKKQRPTHSWAAVLAAAALALAPSSASAAESLAGPSTYYFGGTQATVEASAAFTGSCSLLAFNPWKYSPSSLGVKSYQDCVTSSGVITKQLMDVYLDRCTVEFPPGSHNCVTWSGAYVLSCVRNDGYNYYCPLSGYQRVYGLAAGQYKTRVHGFVYCTCGNGDGWDETDSTFLP